MINYNPIFAYFQCIFGAANMNACRWRHWVQLGNIECINHAADDIWQPWKLCQILCFLSIFMILIKCPKSQSIPMARIEDFHHRSTFSSFIQYYGAREYNQTNTIKITSISKTNNRNFPSNEIDMISCSNWIAQYTHYLDRCRAIDHMPLINGLTFFT